MLSQLTSIKSDPLDVLLFGVGLRLTQLAKSGNPKFKSLLDNRNFTIQMGSEAEGISRYFSVNNGTFSQQAGEATDPTLTITFKDSMTGAKLLTKGDATAFMVGIQKGDLKMSGDYSLLMWFNQVAKFIVPKIPEQLQPVVEHAKPLLQKALPVAQGLFAKVQSLLGGDSKDNKKSKYFNEENTKTTEDGDSKLDTLKAKAVEVKEQAVEKLDELKTEAQEKLAEAKDVASEKLAEVKDAASEKLDEAKEKVADVKAQAETKLDTLNEEAKEKLSDAKEQVAEKVEDVKAQAADKLAEVKDTANEKLDEAKDKAADVKDQVVEKAETVKEQAADKLAEVKDTANEKLDEAKDKAADVKDQVVEKAETVKEQATDKLAEVKDTATEKLDEAKEKVVDVKEQVAEKAEDVKDVAKDKLDEGKKADNDKEESDKTSAQQLIEEKLAGLREQAANKSQEIEAKHADDEIIAENVVTKAVKDDNSPITNITVTRHDDKADEADDKSDSKVNKPAIVVQDKDGNAYKSQ